MIAVWWRTWSLGVKNLWLHPLRSLLTVLGIFFGVFSVIWLLAIGEGISIAVQKQIEGLGADNIIVRSKKPANEANDAGGGRGPVPYGLKRADFEMLKETLPTVKRALPVREMRREFRFQGRLVDGRLVGCTPEYAEVTRLKIERGHFIEDAELDQMQNACVLAANVADRLFPIEDPIGRKIHVDEQVYVVVGIVQDRAPSAGIGGSLDSQDFSNDVYVPITTLWSRVGDVVITRRSGSFEGEIVELSQITLRIDKVDNVLATAEVVKNTLAERHRINDYGVTVPLELLEQSKNTRLMFMIGLGLIAAVSLVVGGIGIMNIMLATVTERTREIGIRRALGAKRRDIARQFLVETIVLSVVGGVCGIVVGMMCGTITSWLRWLIDISFPTLTKSLPDIIRQMEPSVVDWSIPLAFCIAVGVGVVFGLYPAMRAARMDPIEALRHE